MNTAGAPRRIVENLLLQFTYIYVTKTVSVGIYVADKTERDMLVGYLTRQGLITGEDACDGDVCRFSRQGHLYGYDIQYEGKILDELGGRGWERRDRRNGQDEKGQETVTYHFVRESSPRVDTAPSLSARPETQRTAYSSV